MLSTPDERLTSVFDSISDACLLLDHDRCIAYLNEAAQQLLQKNDSEVIGRRLLDAISGPLGAAFKEKCALALKEELW